MSVVQICADVDVSFEEIAELVVLSSQEDLLLQNLAAEHERIARESASEEEREESKATAAKLHELAAWITEARSREVARILAKERP